MSASQALRLEGELTIYTAKAVQHTLLQALATLREGTAEQVLELDLSAITDADTAGLQLLLAARQQAQAEQRDVRLVACSTVVDETAALLGLHAVLTQARCGSRG